MVKARLVWFLMSMLPLAAYALPDDREAIVHVGADTAALNHITRTGTYVGHVTLDQGSTHVRAAYASTTGNMQNQLILAVARGNASKQAHVWTQPTPDKPVLHAYADTIRYLPLRHRIELIGHARLTQGTHVFAAPHIEYDTVLQHVTTQKNDHERTTIIIPTPSHA